jgi:PAS domain S-box-containing protein
MMLEKMKNKVFDVVVSDYQMPKKSGLDFLKELRDSGNAIPFILFTGKGREEVAEKALNLGADRYFNKFGNPETVYGELVHGIRQAVAQRRAEKEIWNREERLRAIFSSSPDAMIITDLNGIITDCNLETLKLLEASSMSDIIGKHSQTLATKDNQDKMGQASKELIEKGFIDYQEATFLSKKGSEVPIGFSASILRDAYGKPVGAVALARNISELKKAEATLRQSECKFRSFFENSPDYCYIISPQGKILEVSKNVLDSLGYSKDELLGKPLISTIYAPSSRKKAQKLFEKWTQTGRLRNEELEIVAKGGERRAVLLNVHSVYDIDGRLLHSVSVQKDITEHRKVDAALKESEEKYHGMVEQAPDSIMTFDLNGVVTSCNDTAARITGYSSEELIGKHFSEFSTLDEAQIQKFLKMMSFIPDGVIPEPFEIERIDEDGHPRFAEIHASLLKDGEKVTGFQTIGRDITARKNAEAALRESERRFRELSELLPEVIFEIDLTGVITFVNRVAFDLFGFSEQDMKKGLNLIEMLTPKSLEKARESMDKRLRGEDLGAVEYTILRKDGTTIPCSAHCSVILRENEPVGIRGILVDITEHKKTEGSMKETLQKMETLNEKIRVIGKLTRHDVRNKLSTIANNTYLTKSMLGKDTVALKNLNSIELSVDQIEKILEFSRVYELLGTEELSYTDVKRSFSEAVMLLSCPNNVEPVTDCEVVKVRADSLLRQIFYNLIDNSLKYGEIVSHIKIYCRENKHNFRLIYEDDGVGIPADEKAKIFLEGSGKGTGFRLYLIQKICENYGWTIKETGATGEGARSVMEIPKKDKNGKPNYRFNTE